MLLCAFFLLFVVQSVALVGDLGWQADAAAAEAASNYQTVDVVTPAGDGISAAPAADAAGMDADTEPHDPAWYGSTDGWRLIISAHLLSLALLVVLMAIWLSQAIAALEWLRAPTRFTASQGALSVLVPGVNVVMPPIVLADVLDKTGTLRSGAAASSGSSVAVIWWVIVLMHFAGLACTMPLGLFTGDDFTTLLMPSALGREAWPDWVFLATDLMGILMAIVGAGIVCWIGHRQALGRASLTPPAR